MATGTRNGSVEPSPRLRFLLIRSRFFAIQGEDQMMERIADRYRRFARVEAQGSRPSMRCWRFTSRRPRKPRIFSCVWWQAHRLRPRKSCCRAPRRRTNPVAAPRYFRRWLRLMAHWPSSRLELQQVCVFCPTLTDTTGADGAWQRRTAAAQLRPSSSAKPRMRRRSLRAIPRSCGVRALI